MTTQLDVGSTLAAQLHAAGFDYAEEIGRGGFGIQAAEEPNQTSRQPVSRATADTAAAFPDGVPLVELGELRDGTALADVVAASLNLREAIEFGLTDSPELTSRMASDLALFWIVHGLLGEGRRWLDQALSATADAPGSGRIEALYCASMLASDQGDLPAGRARVQQARALIEPSTDPAMRALVDIADGYVTLLGGDTDRAVRCLDAAVDACAGLTTRALALIFLRLAHDVRGDTDAALACNQTVIDLSQAHGETLTAFREECVQLVRDSLDEQAYEAAGVKGRSLSFGDAVAYALAER